ncbi:DDB1- and CUL4-associated factor 8-like [Contarinia nasturtii]|uniref:DDB1- and CUL4-associated factor 8-like n=1 Tax=Contarinia nasturtii TaxID=265458 RepID=UPI0012D3BB98|nr:DDB1- and CUL4-associated factor 8-like [Contarinia nasturtii]
MEEGENNNSDSNSEIGATNDSNLQVTTATTSKSPKRYKLDPNVPSTSTQSECNMKTSSEDVKNVTQEMAEKSEATSGSSCGGDSGSESKKNKSLFERFPKRNYRKRSDSQSSKESSPMEASSSTQQSNNVNPEHANNQEKPIVTPPNNSDEAMMLQMDDESSFTSTSSDQDDQTDDDESSESSGNSTENEQKIQTILNKAKPKCDLNLVRNLINRQSGIFYKGDRRIYVNDALRLTQRISSSIYSVERMMCLHKLEKHRGCVNCLNFNKAGNLLVTGSDDLDVIVWNWAKKQPIIVETSHHRANVFQSKFVDNGTATNQKDFNLITSARDGEVRQIQVTPDGSAHHRTITSHSRPVHKIAIPDSNPNEVLTAGEDGCVMRSDLRDNRPSERLVQLKPPLYSVAAHPYDPEFCVCGRDKFVRVYDMRNIKECSKMFCPENILAQKRNVCYINITCALYNHNGQEILASFDASNRSNIYLFDTNDNTPGTYKKSYYGHKNSQTIKGVNFFGSNSEFIMSGSDCGNFFMWDKNSEAIVQWLPGDESGVVNCLEGHPRFPIIATSGLDHDIKIWSPMNAKDRRPSEIDLRRCIKTNLHHGSENFVRTYMRSIARLVNGGYHRSGRSTSDDETSDSDDEEDGLRTFYRPDRSGPCEVQ